MSAPSLTTMQQGGAPARRPARPRRTGAQQGRGEKPHPRAPRQRGWGAWLVVGLSLLAAATLTAYASWPRAAALAGPYVLRVADVAADGSIHRVTLSYTLSGIGAASLSGPQSDLPLDAGSRSPSAPATIPANLPGSAHVNLTPQTQLLYNGSEVAGLSMLLASDGVPTDQQGIAQGLPLAQPLDPYTDAAGSKVWGDPDLGYVGHSDGSGAGGYGIYHGALVEVANHFDGRVVDISGQTMAGLLARLARQHAVLAWIGGDGNTEQWLTPAGRRVSADWSEHAVVVVGYDQVNIYYADPANGSAANLLPRAEFERLWRALGDQALSIR